MEQQLVVRTSQPGWLAGLVKAYKDHTPTLIIDDANIGIDPINHTIFDMGRKAKLSVAEITATCVAVGMAASGIAMVVLAFLDPEPTTKLGLLIASGPEPTTKLGLLLVSGAVLALTGGLSAIHILTKRKPPNIKLTTRGFEIGWN